MVINGASIINQAKISVPDLCITIPINDGETLAPAIAANIIKPAVLGSPGLIRTAHTIAVGKTGPQTKPMMVNPSNAKEVKPIKNRLKIIKIEEVKTICVGEYFFAKGKIRILPAAKARKNKAKAVAPI